MIHHRTILVLGAGASIPFGFPSGSELTRGLVGRLEAPRNRNDLVPLADAFGDNNIAEFRRALALSDQRSIDSFLEHRPEFLEVGKAAIASYLLPHEDMARLFPNTDTWYGYLLDRLPRQLEQLDGRLAVVTFNYDRTLEQYLFNAFIHRYGQTPAQARASLAAIPIHHVYGSLGPLPLDANPAVPAVAFGEPIGPATLTRSASQIRIIHEREHSNDGLEAAHGVLQHAERVIFLGFGYDKTNLDRLLAYGPSNRTMFMGSAKGLTDAEVALARGHIQRLGSIGIPQLDNSDGETLAYLRKYCWFD